MTIIDQPPIESVPLFDEARLIRTVQSYDIVLPVADVEALLKDAKTNIWDMQQPESAWDMQRRIEFSGGLSVRLLAAGDAERLIVPDQYVFTSNDVIYDVSFEPEDDISDYQKIYFGMLDCLEFITLVEAGFLPRPDYLVGATNSRMARFAERAGFESVNKLVEEYIKQGWLSDRVDEPVNDFWIDEMIAEKSAGQLTKMELKQLIDEIIFAAAQALDSDDKMRSNYYTFLANTVMGNGAPNEKTLVWASYDTFLEHVTEISKRLGTKVAKLAQLEVAKAASTNSN